MWLTIGSGEGKGLSVRAEGELFLIGSGTECRLMVGDPKVDPLHAYLQVHEDGRVELHDLGSESGTFVDGERVDGSRRLRGGEEIRVGDRPGARAAAPVQVMRRRSSGGPPSSTCTAVPGQYGLCRGSGPRNAGS